MSFNRHSLLDDRGGFSSEYQLRSPRIEESDLSLKLNENTLSTSRSTRGSLSDRNLYYPKTSVRHPVRPSVTPLDIQHLNYIPSSATSRATPSRLNQLLPVDNFTTTSDNHSLSFKTTSGAAVSTYDIRNFLSRWRKIFCSVFYSCLLYGTIFVAGCLLFQYFFTKLWKSVLVCGIIAYFCHSILQTYSHTPPSPHQTNNTTVQVPDSQYGASKRNSLPPTTTAELLQKNRQSSSLTNAELHNFHAPMIMLPANFPPEEKLVETPSRNNNNAASLLLGKNKFIDQSSSFEWIPTGKFADYEQLSSHNDARNGFRDVENKSVHSWPSQFRSPKTSLTPLKEEKKKESSDITRNLRLVAMQLCQYMLFSAPVDPKILQCFFRLGVYYAIEDTQNAADALERLKERLDVFQCTDFDFAEEILKKASSSPQP